MGTEMATRRQLIVESMVLAFSHSRISGLVGTDALRTVLSGQYRDLVSDGTLNLQPVWDLLVDQPGVAAEDLGPPMCLVAAWQPDLGIDVTLPEALRTLPAAKRTALASRCQVPSFRRREVFAAATGRTGPVRARSTRVTAAKPSAREKSRAGRRWLRHPIVSRLVLVGGLAGFAFTGFTFQRACRGPDWQELSSPLRSEIPIARAERLGSQVGITLADASWLELPVQTRREQLESTLRGVADPGVQVLFVLDQDRQVRGTAQWIADEQQISVVLQ